MTKTITVLVLLVLLGKEGFGQTNGYWEWVHPKPQGNITQWCKVWDNETYYAITGYGGFMKTTNGGLNWTINKKSGRQNMLFSNMITYSDVWYAYFSDQNTGILLCRGGLTRTTDGGITFDSIPGTYIGTNDWLGVNFINTATGYVCGLNGNFAKTTNGGNNWIFNTNVPGTSSYYDIYSHNDSLLILASGDGNILRSDNGGLNWSTINVGSSSTLFKTHFFNKDTGIVVGAGTTVRLTTNSGLNWININSGIASSSFRDIDVRTNGANRSIYLTGDRNFIYKSTNMGNSWDTVRYRPFSMNFTEIFRATDFINEDSFVTVGGYGLIIKKINSNIQLLTEVARANGGSNIINDIWAEPKDKIWAVGTLSASGAQDQIVYSSNGGLNWVMQPSGSTATSLNSICMISENTGFICGSSGTLLKTMNSGSTWSPLATGTSSVLHKVVFLNESYGLIFGTGGGIRKTSNSGLNWVQLADTNFTGKIIYAASFINENTGWIGGQEGRISKTTNGGLNWTPQTTSLPIGISVTINDIVMLNQNTGYLCGSSMVRKTTNGGISWDSVYTPFNSNFTNIDFTDTLNGAIGGWSGLIIRTSNGGQSWQINNPGGDCPEIDMADNNYVYTGGFNYSIFKGSNNLVGTATWENIVPESFTLLQNFPNPFNPSTSIKFSLSREAYVTVKVYNSLGEEVKTIIENRKFNAGTLTYNFSGEDLTTGIYFYSLIIDNKLFDTKKMALIK